MTLGESIRQWRQYRRLRLVDLVRMSDVPYHTIQRVESGKHDTMRWTELYRVTQALGLETLDQVKHGPQDDTEN